MPRKILIVEDVAINRQILKAAIEKDYEIIEAENGEEALGVMRAQADTLSAVLLDIMMPVMNGYDVLRHMRADDALSKIPVVVLTSSEDDDSRVRSLTLGANDFVTKPYNPDIIRHCLANCIALRETAAIADAARRDDLTCLLNRKAYYETVEKMVAEHAPGYYVMACLDIDNFKVINDQYGSRKGDDLLRFIGEVLKARFDPLGGICCRVTADVFSVLYPAGLMESETLTDIRQQIRTAGGIVSSITFRIGRYLVEDKSLTAAAMYDRATLAEAAVKGRYGVRFAQYDEAMREKLIRDQQIISDMGAALLGGQFEVWFQPQYNHVTGALIGAEALVRWRHPEKGLIPPGDFIPMFERNGFVYELDKYVWTQTCRALRKWLDEGRHPLPVSVNVSRYDLFQESLIGEITGIVKKYGLSPDMLRLEITESAFAQSHKQIVEVVKALVGLGFMVEIDDFGSGYSSLNTLKSVPAQIVKLDMRFLDDDDDAQRGGNIIESVVRMVQWLGMGVIAEGVETLGQADYLKSIGCSYVQGYLYAKPIPLEEYEALCRDVCKEERLLHLETVEHLDNNAFWNPRGMDTLIFNSFVGAACIFEYHEGRIELLRATDKFTRLFSGADMTVADVLKINWTEHLDKALGAQLSGILQTSARTKDEVTCEYLFVDLPGCPPSTYLRSSMRVIATTGDRYLVYCISENITAQREAEQKERMSEQKRLETADQLHTIMQNMNGGVSAVAFENGAAKHFVFANDEYYAMQGYTREQFTREVDNVFNRIHPHDRKRVRQAVKEAVRQRRAACLEYRVIRRDGSVMYVRCTTSVTNIKGVSQSVLLGITTDVTELIKSQQNAAKTAEQMKAIMDNINGGVTAVTIEGETPRYLFMNDQYCHQLGYTREQFEAEQADAFSLIYPGDRERVVRETLAASRARRPFSCTYRAVRRGGTIRWMQSNISIINLPGVEEPVQLTVSNDITEQIEAEQKLRETDEQLRRLNARITSDSRSLIRLMNDTPGGFACLRITPNGVLLPDYFNDGFCQMVGMNPSVIMQTYATDAMAAVHPDDREIIRRAASGIYESGEAQGIKYRLRRATGDYIPVVTFARLAQSESGERFLNVYFADATEQDKLETQRRELLDNLPCIAGLYEYRDGRVSIGHLNQRFAEIFGQETAKKEGASAFGNVHPDDQTQIRRGILEAMAAGSDYACDVRIRVINGSYQHFHLNSRILERGRGHWSIYVTLTPITDEALAIAEMLPVALQAVMATQTDYVYVKDRNLRFVCCSRAVARLVGLGNEAQLVGKTDHDVFDKELADQYVLDDRRVVEKGESVLNKLEIVPSSDGKTHYVNVSKYPLCDSRGGVVGLYGISRDVTQALETDTQLRLLTNSIPGGIATYELSPGQIRLTYFNDGFCRLFGLTREACEKDVERDSLKNVNPKDVPALKAQIDALLSDNIPVDCIYRAHTHEGDDKWINIKAVISDRHGDKVTVNAVLFDVTEQQNAMERVRISEEANRLAISHSGCIICRYTVADRTATVPPEIAKAYAIPEQVFDVPYGPVRDGLIAPESVSAYVGFYEDILRGTAGGSVVYRERFHEGWTWREAHFSTIFSDDGKPVSAVISFFDVSDRMEKEAAYKKWQQSMQERDPQSYTLFRCNISKNTPFDTQEGALLNVDYRGGTTTFDERTLEYARQWVYEKDRAAYVAFVKSDALLAGYYRGKHTGAIEYRENLPKGGLRWLRLNVDLVEYPNSSDVEAYLMYENIDQSKRAELLTIERAETDPLTGVLNRSTFAAQIEQKIAELSPGKQHALLMLDVDGFKQVNDVFGHGAGDQVLIDMAVALRSVLRRDDLLGRLGGDEFVVFLNDIPSDAVAAQKAKEILALTRKSLSPDVSISGSIGIAMCPRQGTDFETLYKKADDALYHVKGSGKDSYAFHRDGMEGEREEEEPAAPHVSSAPKRKQKRRMLIVENDRLVCARYRDLFADDFLVECARDGATALIRLRHYGSAISVVLLSLSIPDTDGFLVLEAMQKGAQTQYVPVIAISEDPSREKGLKAIRAGATDYVTKPVDEGLLRIRVQSAVSKAENERLRVQNSFLSLQGDEVKRYKTVLERSGTVVVEYDWLKGTFKYDPAMSRHFAGAYDTRSFWHILLSDMVADTRTVRNMQALVHALAEDRDRGEGSLTVLLKTPGKVMKPFTMTVYKIANEYGLTEKMLITLKRREAD